MALIGMIGGSGLYEMAGFQDVEIRHVDTPFGPPSDAVLLGRLGGADVAFLPRHGRGHRHIPSEINYRANIYALRAVGCDAVVSVSVVGSMKEEIRPGDLVLIDQFIDRTFQRPSTFYGDGVVAHVSFADPVCADLRATLADAAKQLDGVRVHVGGTYLCIEGPQFSTRAESLLYRSWGVSVIGMTNLQEAKLAREAELCYQTIALATDYDCWHESESAVSVEEVVRIMKANIERAKRLLEIGVPRIAAHRRGCACRDALRGAIMTHVGFVTNEARAKVGLFIDRHLG